MNLLLKFSIMLELRKGKGMFDSDDQNLSLLPFFSFVLSLNMHSVMKISALFLTCYMHDAILTETIVY